MTNIFEKIYNKYLEWYIRWKIAKSIDYYEIDNDNGMPIEIKPVEEQLNIMIHNEALHHFKRKSNNKKTKSIELNPFTILQFYLVFITLFIITGTIIMAIIIMIQSLT